jgi:hypothetical protein
MQRVALIAAGELEDLAAELVGEAEPASDYTVRSPDMLLTAADAIRHVIVTAVAFGVSRNRFVGHAEVAADCEAVARSEGAVKRGLSR